MTELDMYLHNEVIRKFLRKTHGEESWFDYSPSDVMFWETVHRILEEYQLLQKEATEAENYIIAKGI